MLPTCRRRPPNIKKDGAGFSARQAALGGRTKKTGQARYFIGYKKHTLRLWLEHYPAAKLLVPLSTWAVPANRGEVLFLYPSLRECQRRLGWLPEWVVGDLAYVSLSTQRRIRQELGVAVITRMKSDMHWVPPYTVGGEVRCPQGQRLQWSHYDPEDQTQWFTAAAPRELCLSCWEQAQCPREFAYPATDHEILLGKVPYASKLARHLSIRVRPWVEPAQAFEKHQLGLSQFFLNSLQLTWVMCLLADMVVLLRAQALLCSPQSPPPFWELTPTQMQFPL